MARKPSVLGQSAVGIVGLVGCQEPVDHHGEHGHLRGAHGASEGEVGGRVLQWGESAVEHSLGEGAHQLAPAGGHLGGPLGIVQPARPVALVEWVQPADHAVAERDGLAADRLGDGGVLTLGVAGDVDASAERDGAGVEALGQRGLAGADDPGEDDIGCGDRPAVVEHPGVVDERAAGLEVLADEDAVAAEPAFGEKRVGASQGGRGVLGGGVEGVRAFGEPLAGVRPSGGVRRLRAAPSPAPRLSSGLPHGGLLDPRA